MGIKTVSLETAKALKEAGFRQDVRFYWGNTIHSDGTISHTHLFERNKKDIPMMYPFRMVDEIYSFRQSDFKELFAAPTSDELFDECIPNSNIVWKVFVNPMNGITMIYPSKDREDFGYQGDSSIPNFTGKNLPEALASMYLWLKKEGLIK